MKLIKPAEISAKIMTLIDEAEKELIVISPYNKITGWTKLINRIKNAQSKGVIISWYSRKNDVNSNNSEEVKINLGIHPVLIDDLHAKVYMNEESAIFTSMNLSKVSDEKSIDLGYVTENKVEYNEILDFVNKHIALPHQQDLVNEIPDKGTAKVLSNKKILHDKVSGIYHINGIHNHILKQFGKFEFEYDESSSLEYFDFIKTGYSIQFITYDQAIKTLIYPPSSLSIKKIQNILSRNSKTNSLLFKRELACSEFDNNVKYYYKSNLKISEWGKNQLQFFLNDLDILVDLVFSN